MDEIMVKPCPFCGGGTVLFRNGTRETVQCICCGAKVSRALWAIDGAVDAWNRRAAGGADPKPAAGESCGSCHERGIE